MCYLAATGLAVGLTETFSAVVNGFKSYPFRDVGYRQGGRSDSDPSVL